MSVSPFDNSQKQEVDKITLVSFKIFSKLNAYRLFKKLAHSSNNSFSYRVYISLLSCVKASPADESELLAFEVDLSEEFFSSLNLVIDLASFCNSTTWPSTLIFLRGCEKLISKECKLS